MFLRIRQNSLFIDEKLEKLIIDKWCPVQNYPDRSLVTAKFSIPCLSQPKKKIYFSSFRVHNINFKGEEDSDCEYLYPEISLVQPVIQRTKFNVRSRDLL